MVNGDDLWDILIVGAGPAGLAAAINGRIREKSVVVVSADIVSPRLNKAPEVKNYPGFEKISGAELQERFLAHARSLGALIEQDRVESIYSGGEFTVVTRENRVYRSKSIILATGIQQASFLPGEKEFLGRGLGYCATCDGPLYRGMDVAVIGEIPEAEDEVNFLAEICRKVYYFPIYEGDVEADKRVNVRMEKPQQVVGNDRVTGLVLPGGEVLPVAGVFIIRKVAPVERLVEGLKSEEGAILVDREMATNIPGVFAAGDCTGRPYQIGKAVGEGLTAALSAVQYIGKEGRD